MARTQLFLLLWLQAVVVGQNTVSWEMGMFGGSEDEGSIEVCADYREAEEGFIVEVTTRELTATDGMDYESLSGTAALLVWAANTTRSCVNIPILEDAIVENDELFYVNLSRVVSSPSNFPNLGRVATVIIMDNDAIQLVFTSNNMSLTDDVGTVQVCVGVSDEKVIEGVVYRIPIVVETVGGSAEPSVDFEPFNNMTVGDTSSGVLTPDNPEQCFKITVLPRPDDGLDDRVFLISVRLREGAMFVPSEELIREPMSKLEVTIQPTSQIEAGDIFDSILSNPLYSVAVDFRGEELDSNLCYEIHGESSTFLNLVSDECFSINAQYSEIDGVTGYNKIDELMIRTSDASDSCIDILTKSEDDCESAFVRSGTSFDELSRRYRRNGVQVDFADASIEILLPCRRYRGGGIKVTVTCLAKYENPRNREFLPVKNLYVEFNRAKLLESTNPLPHGLLGQFWHLHFTKEEFTGTFRDGRTPDGVFQVTTPHELGSSSFLSLHYVTTWDHRYDGCLYAGSRQGGSTNYVTSPVGTVIQGDYTDYKVMHHFATEFKFGIFDNNRYGCPAFPNIE